MNCHEEVKMRENRTFEFFPPLCCNNCMRFATWLPFYNVLQKKKECVYQKNINTDKLELYDL